jgi:hypothetical protein
MFGFTSKKTKTRNKAAAARSARIAANPVSQKQLVKNLLWDKREDEMTAAYHRGELRDY